MRQCEAVASGGKIGVVPVTCPVRGDVSRLLPNHVLDLTRDDKDSTTSFSAKTRKFRYRARQLKSECSLERNGRRQRPGHGIEMQISSENGQLCLHLEIQVLVSACFLLAIVLI